MSRRANGDLRCERCRMLGGLCVCALVPAPPLSTRTRVVLVLHRDEERKPTNSGRLALACLANGETIVRGREGEVAAPLLGPRPVLLFPDADAVSLADFAGGEPVTLVVPDGTWRQAQRVRSRVPGLASVHCAVLPPGPPPPLRLRHEPRPGGLATADAIARALGILDGPDVQAAIERVHRAMVERTLWSRGVLDRAALTDPLPDGVTRDPRRALIAAEEDSMADRSTLEPHVRRSVRDLLERAPAFASLSADERKQLSHDLVDVAGTLALEDSEHATDLPAFVDGLVEGTFQAVVDGSIQQMRAYADLLRSIVADEELPERIRERLGGASRAHPGVHVHKIKWPP